MVSRSNVGRSRIALSVICAVALVAGASFVLTDSPAGADALAPTVVSAGSYDVGAVGESALVTVTLEPGSVPPAAVSGRLIYDPGQLEYVNCRPAPAGMCNDTGGSIRFALIELGGIDVATELMVVEFTTVRANAASELIVVVDEIYDRAALAIDAVQAVNGQVGFAAAPSTAPADADGEADGPEPPATPADPVVVSDPLPAPGDVVADPATVGSGAGPDDVVADPATDPATVGSGAVPGDVVADPGTGPEASGPGDGPAAPEQSEGEGTISGGVVSIATGLPVFGARVCAQRPMLGESTCALTNTDGIYVLTGLVTGNYNVGATDPSRRFADSGITLLGLVSPGSVSGLNFGMPPA